jgi:hypothetical protein
MMAKSETARAAKCAPAESKPKLFIVDVDARLLKRNVELSKGARSLYGTMRALADRRTGKLAIRGKSLDWQTICRQAEVSHCTWRKYRRELLAVGLLWEQRDRREYFDHKNGRMRVGLGKTTYCVRLHAPGQKTVKKPTNLLGANSSTIEELAPQYTQTTSKPCGATAFAVRPVLEPALEPLSIFEPQSSSPTATPKTNDDPLPLLRAKAERILCEKYDADLVGLALDRIMDRVIEKAQPIGSHKYFLKAFENLWQSSEYNKVFDEFQNRQRLREKFMPGFDASKFSDEPDSELTAKLLGARDANEPTEEDWTEIGYEVMEAEANGPDHILF